MEKMKHWKPNGRDLGDRIWERVKGPVVLHAIDEHEEHPACLAVKVVRMYGVEEGGKMVVRVSECWPGHQVFFDEVFESEHDYPHWQGCFEDAQKIARDMIGHDEREEDFGV